MARDIPRNNRFLVRAAVIAGIVMVVIGGALWAAVRRAPPFYRQALACDAAATRLASQQMGSLATALVSQSRKPGRWKGLFTTAQINGWLAVDLARHQRQLLAEGIRDPRVAIDGDRVRIGFRWHARGIATIGSIELGFAMIEPNVVACRLYAARAGSLPLPLGGVIRQVSQLASRAEIPLSWTQTDGDPVAVVTLPSGDLRDDRQIWLDDLQLHDGQVRLAGRTRESHRPTEVIGPDSGQSDSAGRDAKNSNRQWR